MSPRHLACCAPPITGARYCPDMFGGLALLFYVVFAVLAIWAAFWLIRLAVRYGVDDALRMKEARQRAGDSSRAEHR